MSTRSYLVVLACSFLALCSVSCVIPANTDMEGNTPPAVSDADRQLALASSFVQAGDFKRALHIYTMVSNDNPLSPAGATATQMAAFIMTSLRNPARNDSLGAVWFRRSLARTRNADQRLQAEVSLALLDRMTLQTTEMQRRRAVVDSLQRVIRRQSGTILSQTRRLSDMEREVIAAKAQMQRLRELDENLSRTRGSR
jgi:hypothetical protein